MAGEREMLPSYTHTAELGTHPDGGGTRTWEVSAAVGGALDSHKLLSSLGGS